MAILRFIPLFGLVLLGYMGYVSSGGGVGVLDNVVMNGTLTSGEAWTFTMGDAFIVIGVIALYLELFKATRTGQATIVDHTLSMLVFVAYIIMFITVRYAGSSVFFILGLMALVDVIAGFTITIAASRRDLAMESAL